MKIHKMAQWDMKGIYPLQAMDSMGFCGDGMVVNWTGYLQR